MSVIFVVFNLLMMTQVGWVMDAIYHGSYDGLLLHGILSVIFAAVTFWAFKVSLREKTDLPKWLGWIFFCLGLLMMTTVRGSERFLYVLCLSLGLLGDGCLIFYNRKPENPAQPAAQKASSLPDQVRTPRTETVIPDSPQDSRLFKLFLRAENCPTARKTPQFVQTLRECHTCYEELQNRDSQLSPDFQDELEKLLTDYLKLDSEAVQTDKTAQSIRKIEDGFVLVHQVLQKTCAQPLRSEPSEIQADVQELEKQLRMEGLFDDDVIPEKSGATQ